MCTKKNSMRLTQTVEQSNNKRFVDIREEKKRGHIKLFFATPFVKRVGDCFRFYQVENKHPRQKP